MRGIVGAPRRATALRIGIVTVTFLGVQESKSSLEMTLPLSFP
jgi:hypothetical protein